MLIVEDTSTKTTEEKEIVEIVNAFEDAQLHDTLPSGWIDTRAAVASLVGLLSDLPTHPPSMYVDLEGVNLSRHGSISILQIYVLPANETYLVDVHTLKDEAFSTSASNGHTLKSIFESEAIPKALFDVRNDSDALYSLYGIKVAKIWDIQLMELATRSASKRYLSGLAKCIERDLPMTPKERHDWKTCKERGVKLFDPKCGGSYAVFNLRPLSPEIKEYCMQDVYLLPRLWLHYSLKLKPHWRKKVEDATLERIKLSQSANYNGKGSHKALGPWH
ncbi:hypothetical protein NX059_001079 [Plenodomus lindquistii]|nr:hypothetical protein NX059_001079 [Plenodomus lindquistii]